MQYAFKVTANRNIGGSKGIAKGMTVQLSKLPIHHSQRELLTCTEFTDFSLRLMPTFDFIQELLLHRHRLEVLSPQPLRDEMNDIITKTKKRYDGTR